MDFPDSGGILLNESGQANPESGFKILTRGRLTGISPALKLRCEQSSIMCNHQTALRSACFAAAVDVEVQRADIC